MRRGLIALTALRSYDGLATAVLDAQARPRSAMVADRGGAVARR